MASLTDQERQLLQEANFAHLATLTPDGAPQVSPVWVDIDGDVILVNTAEGREKTANVRGDARVALSAHQQSNPYNHVAVKGRVLEVTHEGADAHIDAMAKKYLGQDTYPFRQPGEERVIIRIQPESVKSMFMG